MVVVSGGVSPLPSPRPGAAPGDMSYSRHTAVCVHALLQNDKAEENTVPADDAICAGGAATLLRTGGVFMTAETEHLHTVICLAAKSTLLPNHILSNKE